MRSFAHGFLGGLVWPVIGGLAVAQAGAGESGRGPAAPSRPAPRGVATHIASQAAGEEGIAVRIVFPARSRYAEGAPVAISVRPGSHDENGAAPLNVADSGIVEVHFATAEGAGRGYDFGGPNWILRLRDVIRFALGRATDKDGRTLQDLAAQSTAGAVRVLASNVGIAGFSHGGNACGAVMALHGEEIPELAWYVSWESPYGEGMVGEELGSPRDGGRVNPAYDPGTGRLDLSTLAYDPNLRQRQRGAGGASQGAELGFRGSLFFDVDGDGRYDPAIDFRHQPVMFDAGQGPKFWYSVRLLREAEKRRLFGERWPAHIPTVEEAEEFWRCRDAAGLVPDAVRKLPHLAVIVAAHQSDHMQSAPDHPHILTQVNAFQEAGARFIRLNPDRAYTQWLTSRELPSLPDNEAGLRYDREAIRSALYPDDVAPGPALASVAVCEVADRAQTGNFAPNLDAVLFPDAPRRLAPPNRRAGR
ncbi:MAG: hypothetical protein NTW86_08495 [Candidatus Sumerlaeota bacterium]|nr:hypothetical protein [Candidatus Sumerlaeota bacterium]